MQNQERRINLHFPVRNGRIFRIAPAVLAFAGLTGWWLSAERPAESVRPERPLRIGFHHSPPHQFVAADGSPTGPAIEIVSMAARRRGIPVQWVWQKQAEGSLRANSVDLWPLMGDLPARRMFLHISEPWLTLSFWMVSREADDVSGPDETAGRVVAHNASDIDKRLIARHFASARPLVANSPDQVLKAVCVGWADAGMISGSVANATDLRTVSECKDVRLRLRILPNARIPFGVAASKFNKAAAFAADEIHDEILAMAADGTLSSIYFRWYRDPNNDAMALFYLAEAQRMNRILLAATVVLVLTVILLGWQTRRVRQARFVADRANRVKSQFLANMSHEIRTPMNAVIGMISLVLEKCKDPVQRACLTDAHDAARSLTGLLNDILDLSKVEADRMTVEPVAFELRPAMEAIVRLFEPAATGKNIDLHLRVAPDCPAWVFGDAMRVKQVLVNLTGNAVKFTTEGAVSLHVSPGAGGTVAFRVQDTGAGIPQDQLDRIFEPFTQADGSHTRQFGGSGLGLAISRRLVQLMGGSIRVVSTAGSGSEFVAELPLPGCPPPAPAPMREQAPNAELKGLRLLVAEDNPVNQRVVSAMLSRRGAIVTLACNGEQACREFEAGAFDAVLMDVQMPVMDGYRATAWIRELERRRCQPATPVVALTAHASEADRKHCRAAGMDDMITKPVEIRTLVSALTAATDRVPAHSIS